MTIIGHLVRKDFALLRGRLAMWAAFGAAKFALGFWLVLRAEVTDVDIGWLQGLVAMFAVTDVALTFICTLVLVQEDGVAGTHAFWRTRPISGGRLLAAKVAGAGVLLVIPAVALALPWWWVCGLTAGQTAIAAVQTAVWQVAVITVGFGAGAVSTSPGRALVGVIATGAGLVLANGALSTAIRQTAAVPLQAVLWQLPFLVPVLAGAALLSYFTRDARYGRRLIAGGAAVAVLAPVAFAAGWVSWPQGVTAPHRDHADAHRDDPTLQVTWRSTMLRRFESSGRTHWVADFSYDVSGVPAQRTVVGSVWHEWRRPDGGVERMRSDLQGSRGGGLAVDAVKQLERPPAVEPPRRTWAGSSMVWLNAEQAARLRDGAVDYRCRMDLQLAQVEVATVVPAAGGPWHARRGQGARVVELERNGPERKVQLLESEPLDVWLELRRAIARSAERDPEKIHVVHNPRRNYTTTSVGATRPAVTIGGVSVRVRTLDLFNPTEERDGKRVPKYADWVETTSVATVVFAQSGRLTREVVVNGMTVRERGR